MPLLGRIDAVQHSDDSSHSIAQKLSSIHCSHQYVGEYVARISIAFENGNEARRQDTERVNHLANCERTGSFFAVTNKRINSRTVSVLLRPFGRGGDQSGLDEIGALE